MTSPRPLPTGRRRGALPAAVLGAGVLALLTACGSGGESADAAGGATGGTLRIAATQEHECRDPQLDNYSFGPTIGRQIADSLTERSLDDPKTVEPWLAKSWEISDDATTYTFHLREGVTFSDGEKLTAAVVKQNFETLAGLTGSGAAFVKGIKEIATPDELTVVITFEKPNAAFLQNSAQYHLSILSPKTVAKSYEERCAEGAIGSGPFVVSEWVQNERTVLTHREGYNWASDARKHQGEAYVEKVVFQVIPEASVRTGALLSGQQDIVPVATQDASAVEKAGNQILRGYHSSAAVGLQVNTSRGVLADEKVRQALRVAIDRQDVVAKAHGGYTRPATGSLTAASPFHKDQPDLVKHDPEQAKSLLEQAGWTAGPDGIRTKDGKPLTVTVTYVENPDNTRFLEVIQQQVKSVGFDLKLRPVTSGEYDKIIVAGDYDLHRWSGALVDGDVLRSLYSAKALNKAQLPENNDLEPLFEKQLAIKDADARRAEIEKIQDLVVGRAYQIPVFDNLALYGAAKGVSGVAFDDQAILLYDVQVRD